MSHQHEGEITREEIKKEFQLERMILFSDAVFAIVITLMAIEIKLPEGEKITAETLPHILAHLGPVLFSYLVSFVFIGITWYQHLKLFAILKDYDKGLVVRNLMLLFFIGMFPFGASVVTRGNGLMLAYFIYTGIILLCLAVQYLLYDYIIVRKPALRLNTDMKEHAEELDKKRASLAGFFITILLVLVTYWLIPNPETKPLAMLLMTFTPLLIKIFKKKKAGGRK